MLCGNCGEESTRGAFFCGGCGRPLGFERMVGANAEETPGLTDVPAPEKSREPGPTAETVAKALCGRCMGAYPETELATVDSVRLCGDCNTLTASRAPRFTPGPTEAKAPPRRTVSIPDPASPASSGGARRILVALGLMAAVAGIFAVVALPGSDRIDRLLSGANEGNEVVQLAQTYTPGESFEYGMEMRTKIVAEADNGVPFGGGASGDMEIDLEGLIRIDVLSVDAAGNGRVHLTFSGFDCRMRAGADGEQIDLDRGRQFDAISESSVTMTLDPYGKLLGEAEIDGPGVAGLPDLRQLFGEGLDGAPRGGLKVGDVWRSRTSIGLDPGGSDQVAVDAEYEVVGFKNCAGHPCVAVSVVGSISGQEKHGLEVDADLKGAMLIHRETGTLIRSAMDARLTMSGSSPMGSIDFQMEMSVDVDLK